MKRTNRISNEMKKKQRASMIIIEGENQDLISVSVDGSHEKQGQHKEVSSLLS